MLKFVSLAMYHLHNVLYNIGQNKPDIGFYLQCFCSVKKNNLNKEFSSRNAGIIYLNEFCKTHLPYLVGKAKRAILSRYPSFHTVVFYKIEIQLTE